MSVTFTSTVRAVRFPSDSGTAVSCISASVNRLPSSDTCPRNSCGIPRKPKSPSPKLLQQIRVDVPNPRSRYGPWILRHEDC